MCLFLLHVNVITHVRNVVRLLWDAPLQENKIFEQNTCLQEQKYCDVHAVGLTGQQRKNAFLGNG
jgi:hypothetical protein